MTTNHRIPATAGVILTLVGVAAPGATARPADDPAIGVNRAPAIVYSRPDKSLIPVSPPATSGGAGGRAAYREGQLATAADAAARAANRASAPRAVVRIQTPQSGFDWGDAGIGAAGGLALSLIGVGGALAVSQNRARRTRRTTAVPS
ncbi:MAG TPA: hypothetical protein VJU80_12840 [Solirubrobacteraceae bacterium]|nr:hypothetical protein [Solirubrobacteraceae bacterium]